MKRKYALSSSLIIIALIAAVILLNVFVSVLGKRVPLKIDMTQNDIYSLSDSTKQYLKTYDTPTDIYILAGEAEQDDNIHAILDRYSLISPYIKVKNINISQNPTFGKKYVTDGKSLQANSVVIDGGDRFRVLTLTELYGFNSDTGNVTSIQAEAKITSALRYVSSDTELIACIINGHNETDAAGIRTKLEGENYSVTDVNLLTDEIPQNAAFCIIFAPKTDFTDDETAKLDRYLSNGGGAQFYFDNNSRELTRLYGYLKMWGIGVSDKLAVETDIKKEISVSGTSMSLVSAQAVPDELTESIIENNRTIAYFKYSKALDVLFEQSGDIGVTPLLKTSDSSYTSSDYEDVTKKDENSDGAKNICVLAKNSANKSSVLVSGTTLLLSIDPMQLTNNFGFANFDCFMNISSFMQGNDSEYTAGTKTLVGNRIMIGTLSGLIIGIVYALLLPLAVLVIGIVVWARRRHL